MTTATLTVRERLVETALRKGLVGLVVLIACIGFTFWSFQSVVWAGLMSLILIIVTPCVTYLWISSLPVNTSEITRALRNAGWLEVREIQEYVHSIKGLTDKETELFPFWEISYGSIYALLRSMEDRGLVERRQKQGLSTERLEARSGRPAYEYRLIP